jgi:hypothetical protein
MEVTKLVFKLLKGSSEFPLKNTYFFRYRKCETRIAQQRPVPYLIQFFFAAYWSVGFGTLHQARTNLASHWQEAFAEGKPTEEKLTNKTPITLSEVPAPSQTTFITGQLQITIHW